MRASRLLQGGEVTGRAAELAAGPHVRGNSTASSNRSLPVAYFGALNIIFVLFEHGVLR